LITFQNPDPDLHQDKTLYPDPDPHEGVCGSETLEQKVKRQIFYRIDDVRIMAVPTTPAGSEALMPEQFVDLEGNIVQEVQQQPPTGKGGFSLYFSQPVLGIRITLMRVRILLFTLMRIRIRMQIRIQILILDPDLTVN
jgi:hypothetical protein